jgi:hypothetical protein
MENEISVCSMTTWKFTMEQYVSYVKSVLEAGICVATVQSGQLEW